MTEIFYSLADLVLIITIVECVLTFCLIVIARAMPAPSKTCRLALGALFLTIAVDALSMLLIWHHGIATLYTAHSLIPFVLASLALASKGPLLYWFIRTLTQPDYTLKKRHLWHAIPALIGLVTVFIGHLDVASMTIPIESNQGTPGAFFWWSLMRVTPVLYAMASLIRLRAMSDLYDSHYTGNEYHYSYWIKLLVVGFLVQWGMGLLTHIAGQYLPTGAAATLGKLNDILGLILVNGLLIYSFTLLRTLMPMLGSDEPHEHDDFAPPIKTAPHHSRSNESSALPENTAVKTPDEESTTGSMALTPADVKSPISTPPPHKVRATVPTFNYQPHLRTLPNNGDEHTALEAIAQGVHEQHLHLIHTLNIEKFARAINHPTKEVSRLINTYYGCSFSEFINAYRTMEAERLLKSPQHYDTPVVEIISLSGFNSKSAFHRFFKRFTEQSPSEYRAMQLAASRLAGQ